MVLEKALKVYQDRRLDQLLTTKLLWDWLLSSVRVRKELVSFAEVLSAHLCELLMGVVGLARRLKH